MENLVNETVRNRVNELHERFVSAQPFHHVAINDFLKPGFAHSLLDSFPAFDEKLAINENGEVGGKAVHERISGLGRSWRQLDKLVKGDEFRSMISDITGIPELEFDPHYFGGGTHENLHGQALNPHVDFNFHPITRQHRRLNLILYLSPEWQPEWGGSIQLHRDPYKPPAEDDIITIAPEFNRCVIFETNEYSWHGFKRIDLPVDKRDQSRKSFALYYYTDTRPAEELGAEHSTIYVEEHLPEDFHAGMELSAGQLQHTRNLLNSRDQHLKRLYDEIKQLHYELSYLRGDMAVVGQNSNFSISEGDGPEVLILKKQIFGLQRRIQEFEKSTSWRVTKPLRALKRRLSQRS